MKRFFAFVLMLALAGTTWNCSDDYDDSALWREIDGIRTELAALNSQLEALQTALRNGSLITDVKSAEEGYVLTFSDGSVIEIRHGRDGEAGLPGADGADGVDGADGKTVGVRPDDAGVLCWTLGGEFVVDPQTGDPLPVRGAEGPSGKTPVLAVDVEGFWTVDGVRLTSDGREVKAQGDSFFSDVREEESTVTLVLADGSELTIPKAATGPMLAFADKIRCCESGTPVRIGYTSQGIGLVEIFSLPEGWRAEVDTDASEVIVTAGGATMQGRLVMLGADSSGRTYMAVVSLCSLPEGGFYVWNEGWFGHDPASLNYYRDGVWFTHVYATVNPGASLGNTGTNMVRCPDNGLVYLVCKDDPTLVEVDANMLRRSEIRSKSTTGQGYDFAPYDATTGYMSGSKGLYRVALDPLRVDRCVCDERGTFADVHVARGKVFFIHAGSVKVYDPADEQIVTLCAANTGFRESADGMLWAASAASIARIDPRTLAVETISTGSFSLRYNSTYNPCAFDVTPDGGTFYYFTGSRYSATGLVKCDVATGTMTRIYDTTDGFAAYGGGVAVHPATGDVYLLTCKSYSLCRIYVVAPDGQQRQVIPYTTDTDMSYWFPSQIVFN